MLAPPTRGGAQARGEDADLLEPAQHIEGCVQLPQVPDDPWADPERLGHLPFSHQLVELWGADPDVASGLMPVETSARNGFDPNRRKGILILEAALPHP